MAEITFNEETMQYVSLFQDLTQTTVVDCLDTPDRLLFVVKTGDIARAIGRGGEHVQTLRRRMNKDIHVVEYSEDPEAFVSNPPPLASGPVPPDAPSISYAAQPIPELQLSSEDAKVLASVRDGIH